VLPKICAELRAYRRDLKQVRKLIDFEKDQTEWLDNQATAFRKRAKRAAKKDPAFEADLLQLAKQLDEVAQSVRSRLKERWRYPSLDFWNPYEGHLAPLQERQLDSRFQVRLAVILRTFIQKHSVVEGDQPGPPLRTIARLIVLFVVCADLAEVKHGEVILKHNKRRITVDGVFQQLNGAGIDRLIKSLRK
jgi:hypothetical protein